MKCLGRSGAKVCKSCRSRQELSHEYVLAKIGFDTAENELLRVQNVENVFRKTFESLLKITKNGTRGPDP